MDVHATEDAIEILEDRAKGFASYPSLLAHGLLTPPSTVGKAVLESAAYRLRLQLREYLTRGTK